MKSQSNIKPLTFRMNDLGGFKELILCENITQFTNQDNEIMYEYDMTLLTTKSQTRDNLIADLVSMKYTKDEELALINKAIGDITNAEYIAYREYVAWCKNQF
jgi:hypothetical protein